MADKYDSGPKPSLGFVDRRDECFAAFRDNADLLAAAPLDLHDDLTEIESQITALARTFNRATSAGPQRLFIEWSVNSVAENRLGPYGPYANRYAVETPGRPKRLSGWPRRRDLQRYTAAAEEPHRWLALHSLKSITRTYKKLRDQLRPVRPLAIKINKRHGFAIPLPTPPPSTRYAVNDTQAHRLLWCRFISDVIRAIRDRILELDQELLELQRLFNGQGRRRRGSLSASFHVRGRARERILGPGGPWIYTVSYHGSQRRTRLLKTGNPPRNRITLRAIRSRYLGKEKVALFKYGRQLESARDERMSLRESLLELHTHLRHQIQGLSV